MGKKNTGFTLIELIVTITLAAILLTLGIPAFQEVIKNNRLVTQVNELVTALNTARSEAIKRGVRVTMCKSTNQTSCSTAGDVYWEDGWIVFSDPADIGTYNSSTEELILVSSGLEGDNKLRTGANFTNYLSYMPNGESRGGTGYDTFRLCDDRGTTKGRSVVISTTGRIRTKEEVSQCP